MTAKRRRTVPYLTKALLEQANAIAIERAYKMSLADDFVDELPADGRFPVVATLVREAVDGKPVGLYVQCMVRLDEGDTVVIDIDMELYECLPTAQPWIACWEDWRSGNREDSTP